MCMAKSLVLIGVVMCLTSMVAGLGGDSFRVVAPQLIVRTKPALAGDFAGSVVRNDYLRGSAFRGWLNLHNGKGFVSTRFLRPAVKVRPAIFGSSQIKLPAVGRNLTVERRFSIHLFAAIFGYVGLVCTVWLLLGLEIRRMFLRPAAVAPVDLAQAALSGTGWWDQASDSVLSVALPEGLPALDLNMGHNIVSRLTTSREQNAAIVAMELPPLGPEADVSAVPVLDLA
jgi:hypothetical protein